MVARFLRRWFGRALAPVLGVRLVPGVRLVRSPYLVWPFRLILRLVRIRFLRAWRLVFLTGVLRFFLGRSICCGVGYLSRLAPVFLGFATLALALSWSCIRLGAVSRHVAFLTTSGAAALLLALALSRLRGGHIFQVWLVG